MFRQSAKTFLGSFKSVMNESSQQTKLVTPQPEILSGRLCKQMQLCWGQQEGNIV